MRTKLGDYIEQVRGVSYSGDEVVSSAKENYLPVLRANNIYQGELNFNNVVFVPRQRISQKQLINKGDIIIAASSGSKEIVGKAALAKSNWDGSFGAFCKLIRVSQKIIPSYLNYFFKSHYYRKTISSVVNGANINNLRNEDLDNIEIPLPSLEIQRENVSKLDDVYNAVQKRKVTNALTDQFLQSTFLSMFGDPMLNDKKWNTSHLKKLFLSKPSLGTTTPVSDGGMYKVVRVGEIGRSSIDLERCKFVNLSDADRARYNLKKGDLLLARAIGSLDHLGKASLIQKNDEQLVFDSHIMRLRFDQSKLNSIYFYYLLESEGGRKIFLTASSRTAVQFNINSAQISEMNIPVPPLSLQQKFASIVAYTEQLRQKQKQSEIELENLFQALLQKYFG